MEVNSNDARVMARADFPGEFTIAGHAGNNEGISDWRSGTTSSPARRALPRYNPREMLALARAQGYQPGRMPKIVPTIPLAILACTAITIVACDRQEPAKQEGRKSPGTVKYLQKHYPLPSDFDSKEMKSLKRRALQGEAAAADQLIDVYDSCLTHHAALRDPAIKPTQQQCQDEIEQWAEVAAVDGSPVGAMRHYNHLSRSRRCEDVYRSHFWLRRIPNHQSTEPWTSEEKRVLEMERRCEW